MEEEKSYSGNFAPFWNSVGCNASALNYLSKFSFSTMIPLRSSWNYV